MLDLTFNDLLVLSMKRAYETPFGPLYESQLVPPNELWFQDAQGRIQKIVNIGVLDASQ